MKKGFTLVELAIVLVIIGLLIGGILVAQSMMSTAQVEMTVKQIQGFDAAVANFKTKYKGLVSDSPLFGGDGNGLIDSGNGLAQVNNWCCEMQTFWYTLDSVNYPSIGVPPTSNSAPISKIGVKNAFWQVQALSSNQRYADLTINKNYYFLCSPGQVANNGIWRFAATFPTSGNIVATPAVKPADLQALDTKMDDGVANTGYVLSGGVVDGGGGAPGYGAIGTNVAPLTTCSTGGTYASGSAYACTPLIEVGAQTGDPQ